MRFRTPQNVAVPVAFVSLLLLGLGVSGGWYALRLQRQSAQIVDVNVAGIRAGEEIELNVREVRHELERFLLSRDIEHLKAALARRKELDDWLQKVNHVLVKRRDEAILMARVAQALDQVFDELEPMALQRPEAVSGEKLDAIVQETLSGPVLADARRFLDINEAELERSSAENQSLANRLVVGLFLLGTCGAIAGLVAGYGVTRGLGRAMVQLSVSIRDVAGKLNEVVGPVSISADLGFEDLEKVLREVSAEVDTVVRRLHDTHREMMRADQLAAVGQLAAGLAHELRNPLMCIKVLVQSAMRRKTNGAPLDREDLAVLEAEVRRLEDLLQTFLDFARPGQLQKRPVDLRELAERTVAFLLGKASRRKVAIHFQDPAQPVVVDADESQLRQVLLNLLLNALDAVHVGGAITVAVARDDGCNGNRPEKESASAMILVSDDGPGLPQKGRDRLFEPFFSTKETGLGLGLAMCKRIVESHGGTILACDAPARGAMFTVRLPLLPTANLVPAAIAIAPLH